MKKFILLLLFIPTSLCSLSAQSRNQSYLVDPGSGSRDHTIDLIKMTLDVSFVPEKGLVKGKVTHVFKVLRDSIDTLFFDAPSIKILNASFNGKPVPFDIDDKGVIVRFETSLKRKLINLKSGQKYVSNDSITFIYEATPRKGIYFIGWNAAQNMFARSNNFGQARKQIWTQGQGIDNRHWIPMYDDMNDKMITETIVHFDKEYKVLSNGTKISETMGKDNLKTWHYRMTHPHPSYLLMLGIGKYESRTVKSARGVIMHQWYYPGFENRIEPTYRASEKMMDYMEAETGLLYPWESYAQIPTQDFIYGAMENTTATIFGDFFMNDEIGFNDRNYLNVNAHELVHQWFGDYVTARSSRHAWLQESFATHYGKHFMRSIQAEEEFQWARQNELLSVLSAAKNDAKPIVHSQAGSARIYAKGSLVLDMIRYTIGEDHYKRALTHFLTRHPYANVDTDEFQKSFQDALGMNLDWFFEEWLYKGGEPKYEVKWRNIILDPSQMSTPQGQAIYTYGGQETEISVAQIHDIDELVGYFKMPITFQVFYADGSSDFKKEWIDGPQQIVHIPNPKSKPIDFVLFDSGNQIIKTLVFKRSLKELKSQAMKANQMIDRYDAVVAMRDSSLTSKREILWTIYSQEKFHAIKGEILAQLSRDISSESISIFESALRDPDLNVRKLAVQNTKIIAPSLRAGFEKALTDSSYEIIQTALEKLCAQFPENLVAYLEKTKNYFGIGNSVRVKWLELNALKENNTSLQELIEMSGSGYEFRTRISAIASLQSINYLDVDVVRNLCDAILSTNHRLAAPAIEALNYYSKQRNLKEIISGYYKGKEWETWQKETLQRYIQ